MYSACGLCCVLCVLCGSCECRVLIALCVSTVLCLGVWYVVCVVRCTCVFVRVLCALRVLSVL